MDGAIGAHGQAVAQMGAEVVRADAGDHHLFGDAAPAQAQGFFQGNIVKGIRRQLDAVGDDAAAIGFHLDAHVVVHDALVTDQDLHESSSSLRWVGPVQGREVKATIVT